MSDSEERIKVAANAMIPPGRAALMLGVKLAYYGDLRGLLALDISRNHILYLNSKDYASLSSYAAQRETSGSRKQ